MVALPVIALRRYTALRPANLFAMGYFVILIISMQNYLRFSPVFLLGILALPSIFQTYSGNTKSYRYVPVVLITALLCFLMPVKTLLYFTICFSLILLRESLYGKTGILAPAIVILISPAFKYLANTFSFPLRLQLTRAAGYIFQLMGYETQTEGNVIIRSGNEFSVDPACMGLSMITTSLLFGIILISFYQRKFQRKINVGGIFLYLAAILLLNLFANLFRIVILVLFDISPGTISHDIAGIGCLLLYVFLPAVWLASWMTRRFPVIKEKNIPLTKNRPFSRHVIFHLGLIAFIAILTWKVMNTTTFNNYKIPEQGEVPGYSLAIHSPGIIKLENKNVLVYIKYIRGFYDTDHNPMICWTGSGYQFQKVMEDNIGSRHVFTATLANGKDKLYTAWWYDNGKNQTTEQFSWRMDLLKGSPGYALINVTCSDKNKLKEEAEKILKEQKLSAFFKP